MYKPKKTRKIFQYHDGTKERWIDPLHVTKKLYDLEVDFEGFLARAEIAEQEGKVNEGIIKDLDALIQGMRNVLGIPEYQRTEEDGVVKEVGLLDEEVTEVFYEYLEYITDVKKNTNLKPNSQPATAPQS